MSWNISFETPTRNPTDLLAHSKEAFEEFASRYSGDAIEEMREQCAAAAGAAAAALEVVGTEGPWFLSLGGHANPGHGKRPGWSNDTISISIAER